MSRRIKILPILAGPLVFITFQFFDPPAMMSNEAYQVLLTTLWIAIWWIFEAIPIAATALLPVVLFPLTGALELATTTSSFGHKYVFLYLGGFIIAIAIEKWGLHKRIALGIIALIGSNMTYIILGFMIATAFLSMWISNTATAVMMLPIGMAVISQFSSLSPGMDSDKAGKALMLGIAYSASIGGIATIIGTPPNLVLAGVLKETYDVEISFFDWMKFGLPLSGLLLFICWKYLTRYSFRLQQITFPGGMSAIKQMRAKLGGSGQAEKSVLLVFLLTAVLWIFRSLLQNALPQLDDTIIAMSSGILLFILPSGHENEKILNWKDCLRLPWDIILLFGGGMALAKGFTETRLADWIALRLAGLQGIHLLLLILILVSAVNFLTEVTSNLATTAMLLPVLAPMAQAFDLHPFMVLVPVTLAASCAFMLPVATPPNAVVFGSGYLRIPDMMKAGILLNVLSILIITLMTYFLLPIVWDFPEGVFSGAFEIIGLSLK
ncbi:MAG: DASS family sodium-coupled anion symporter [Bacteroidota bacterium]